MNKTILLLVLWCTIGTLYATNNDNIEQTAKKFDAKKDFYTTSFSKRGGNLTVRSYFDLFQYPQEVAQALTPGKDGVHDLRRLEICLCKAAQKTMPWYKAHRGLVCFNIGAVYGVCVNIFLNKYSKH